MNVRLKAQRLAEHGNFCDTGIEELLIPVLTSAATSVGVDAATAASIAAATAPAVTGVGLGAAGGAGLGALTGEGAGKGALGGAITGGTIGAAGPALGAGAEALGVSADVAPIAGDVAAGAIGGTLGGVATGQPLSTGALGGAGAGLVAGLGTPAATPAPGAGTVPGQGGAGGGSSAGSSALPGGPLPGVNVSAGLGAPPAGAGGGPIAEGVTPLSWSLTPGMYVPGTGQPVPAGGSSGSPFTGTQFTPEQLFANPNDPNSLAVAGGPTGGSASPGTGTGIDSIISKITANPGILASGGLLGLEALRQNKPLPEQAQLNKLGAETAAQGAQLSSYLSTGTLPPGANEALNLAKSSAKAQIRSTAAQLGLSGSTWESDRLGQLDQQAAAEGEKIATQLLSAGADYTKLSTGIFENLLKETLAQDSAFSNALSNFAGGLAGARLQQPAATAA